MWRFGDIAVVVRDAKRSAKWFHEKLGFEIRDPETHWVTVALPKSKTLFHLCEADKPEKGNTGIGFVVKDVSAEEKKLKKKGVKFTTSTTKAEWGTFAMFADPDGNEFWLSEG